MVLILSILNIASTILGFLVAVKQIRMASILYQTGDMYGLVITTCAIPLALDILTTATLIEWLIRQRRECINSYVRCSADVRPRIENTVWQK